MYTDELQNAVELLTELIAIPSISRDESKAADYLEKYLEERGYVVSRNHHNIWMLGPGFDTSKKTILLNSHIDTVKPVDGWTRDPFNPVTEGDKLYGLGSNDAGAGLVSLLQAFFYLTSRSQPYNLIFAASAEEEVSGVNGMESLLKELPAIDLAIVGEPTGMRMAVAEKGLMVLDCTAHGVAGHAARSEGDNAIYHAIRDIEWFRDYRFPKVSPLLGAVKMTVTQVSAGTQHNVIPDKCTYVVDVRSNELYSNTELLEEIRKNVQSAVNPRSTRLSSSSVSADHPVVKRGLEIGLEPFGSPTLSDQALMPFTSIKIGPGESARSHTADEFIYLDEIAGGISRYIDLLDGLIP